MHPYELGHTLHKNCDERSIKFNHGSLYIEVGQLAKAGFITEQDTIHEGQPMPRTHRLRAYRRQPP
jgi:DNA-binding PadR family transcriptional regulator